MPAVFQEDEKISDEFELDLVDSGLDSIESTIDIEGNGKLRTDEEKMGSEENGKGQRGGNNYGEELEGETTQLDLLLKLCEADEEVKGYEKVSDYIDDLDFREEECCFEEEELEVGIGLICCPLCGNDISKLTDELRQVHTNECLDKDGTENGVSF